MTARRSFLRLAGAATVVAAAYGGTAMLRRLTEPDLIFRPVPGLSGFRQVDGGPVSGGATFLIGIEDDQPQSSEIAAISDSAVCDALFDKGTDLSRVQIAYFSDYRCYYCRTVSPMLTALSKEGEVTITWHDLPLLGPTSTIAARAAVAADAQGAYEFFHDRLMSGQLVPNPPYLKRLAHEAGIDPGRLLRDMQSPETQKRLRRTAALAQRFGFIGTPAVVIGRTAVLGSIDRRLVDRLIELERQAELTPPC